MKKPAVLFAILMIIGITAFAQAPSRVSTKDIVELALLTHTEVYDKIHDGGMTSVLIVTGGTEERQHSRCQGDDCENRATGYWNGRLPQPNERLLSDDWQEEPCRPYPCRKKDQKHAQ